MAHIGLVQHTMVLTLMAHIMDHIVYIVPVVVISFVPLMAVIALRDVL